MITLEQFKAIDIRIAKIIDVMDHPNADKLYVMRVNVGDKTKTLVAGIKQDYTKEELINRQVVVVDNLEPATIRGIRSEGMLLATLDEKRLAILVPEKEVKTGSPVR